MFNLILEIKASSAEEAMSIAVSLKSEGFEVEAGSEAVAMGEESFCVFGRASKKEFTNQAVVGVWTNSEICTFE